ncbi:phosphatidylserine decarboxylase [Xenococcus sp. PCC 7305]|uniref:phosphatidylserine decarboxylase family protein n=1 Tax=Xenococcus sp. PCC 7305 TaxID=102125 RepID=UPI0002AB9FEA|nr:phosphatidylserine decarboxylase family protein [Xenococcus sp. PCC 7305]ELS02409.1 phosphatidylserine decarboxylase [Xenococcus sp. PCC 7305]
MLYQNPSSKIRAIDSVDHIHAQMESNPHFPFNVQSGWLPMPSSKAMAKFLENILGAEPTDYAPCIEALNKLLESNDVLTFLINSACEENSNIIDSNLQAAEAVNVPRIASKDDLLNAFNNLLNQAPQFVENELVGLPFSAVVVGIDPTQSGMTLFRLPMFNEKMGDILNVWSSFLCSEASNTVFSVEGEQWLSPQAKQQYQFEVWQKDNENLPYWNSWNSFFTRQFKDQEASRPVAQPNNNQIVVSANDGSLFRWDENIAAKDVFWFKDMTYSLANILSSDIPAQQQVLDKYNLVDLFTDGSIFQTYLNPYNYHRWWCPVKGKVLFDPISVPGYYFNKLVIPDFAGATTSSLPYLAQVNARGLIVFKTEDYGYVCCIPLGMSEVSSIVFDPCMKANASVTKGQEMGTFQYGGSSYVIIFQKLPGKRLIFQNGVGDVYDKRPVLPKGSASTGGNVTLIGSQIGKWEKVDFNIDATQAWQNAGYVNTGDGYNINYVGGLWTANPEVNNGNLYNANGSDITATQDGYPLVGAKEGALIGRVGNNPSFLIGNGASIPSGQAGHLQLCINDDLEGQYGAGLTDNEGQITVSITAPT